MNTTRYANALHLVSSAVETQPASEALRLARNFIGLHGWHVAVRLAGMAPPSPLRELRGMPSQFTYAMVGQHAGAR